MTYRPLAILSGVLAAFPLLNPAAAQIQCARATTPVDKAICASPDLLAQDRTLAEAYRDALARMPGQTEAIRQAQLRWLAERGRQCGQAGGQMEACLSQAFSARIAALAATGAPQASPQAGGDSKTAAAPTPAPTPRPAAPGPAQAAPPATPPTAAAPAPLPQPAWPEPAARPTAALPPGPATPAPAARLARESLPTAGQGETMLEVQRPGRFAIRAESPTGTALQLVDMLSGPGEESGAAGAADGRLDVLLDVGTYKLRTQGAENAQGETRLSVTPFAEAAPPAILRRGDEASAELGDLQQRSFWFVVDRQRPVRIEAAGRALRDLRLWREGRDLVAAPPEARITDPTAGRTLNTILLTPELEPGTYLITAYGGPSLPWAEGGSAQPFHLRLDASDGLAAGWVSGVIGPLGSAVFDIDSQADRFRLTLPEPAPVGLEIRTGPRLAGAILPPDRREPVVLVSPGPRGQAPRQVVVHGREGQRFQLRAFGGEVTRRQPAPGTYLMGAEMEGLGGDNIPATAVLRRDEAQKPSVILGGIGPRVAPGQAWRGRFNLRGPASLLLEVTAPGPIALRADGVAVNASIQPLAGPPNAPPANGDARRGWDLAPGWYRLTLQPPPRASGILDLTIGPPGLTPPQPSAPQPADPVLAFGPGSLAEGQRLNLITGTAGGTERVGLIARPLPLDTAGAPLMLTQLPGQALELPLNRRPATPPAVTLPGGGTVEAQLPQGNPATLRIPAPSAPRMLVLAFPSPAAPPALPRPQPLPNLATLEAGQPAFTTLGREEQRSFALRVPEGGLYRVETLGRLHMRGSLGTAFQPDLQAADGNGTGQNMLIQQFLRAGDYRLNITAVDSAGRVGLQARPAPMATGTALLPGTTARAALPAGEGIAFPIEITENAEYRFDLPSLGRDVTARLEDAEGWPLVAPGSVDGLVQRLRPGRYRLVVMPADVESRIVARLTQIRAPQAREGHGPFPLPFGTATSHRWREPAERDAPRAPDQWEFSLAGPAKIMIAIDNGMAATLLRLEGETPTRVAALADGSSFLDTLPAGRYRLEARPPGRNDRVDYSITLDSEELQPGVPRSAGLPSNRVFTIAEDRVVSLTTFGATAVRAALRDSEGRVIARDEGQASDWNIATSRLLPAGRYSVDLTAITTEMTGTRRANGSGEEMEEGEADTEASPEDQERPEADSSGEMSSHGEASDSAQITLTLSLPEARPPVPAATSGTQLLEQGGVHRLTLPAAPEGSLMLASAQSSETLVLSLERQQSDGSWRSVTTDRGTSPVVAVPAEPGAAWRAAVWTIEGTPAPIRFAARIASPAAQAPGRVTPTALEGLPGLFLAAVEAPGSALLSVRGGSGLRQGDAAGRGLRPVEDGLLTPQSGRVWLLAGSDAPLEVAALRPAAGSETVLNMLPGDTATLPAADTARPRLYLARQDGPAIALQAGRGMGVARGSTLALAGGAPLRVTNGLSRDVARVALRILEPEMAPAREAGSSAMPLLPANTAQPLQLPQGPKRLRLDLAPGTAAILGWQGEGAVTLWPGDEAASRSLEGEWRDILLVNTTGMPAPVSLSATALDAPALALRPGRPLRRFVGATGGLVLPVAPDAGQEIAVAGARARFVGADGRIAEGARIAPGGPGWLLLEHGPGPVVAWLEGQGASPWPAGTPQAVALPRQLRLTGDSMSLALSPAEPVLLHARTTAPVVLALGGQPPEVFAAGAEFHRYLPAGAAVLNLLSPQDGPLTGSLELTATPVTPAVEGVGAPVMVGAGNSVLFGFEVPREGWIGFGIRAEPDGARVRLLDAAGVEQGQGVAQLRRLPAGRYLIEASIPPGGLATAIRPAILGLTPRPSGPPPEIARRYQEMAGIAPAVAR